MLRKTAKASIKNEVENVKPEAIRWLAQVFNNYLAYLRCSVYTEFGNITSKCNGVTRYCLCHVLRAIIFRSDNGSYFDRAITFRNDNIAML
jgi:hypothetical protein